MYEKLTFLSERQNLLLLEKVFSSTSYKEIKEFLYTLDLKPINDNFYNNTFSLEDNPLWFEQWTRTSGHSKIYCSGHVSAEFIFRIPDDGIAKLVVYLFSGDEYKPIPIIYYYYPTKIFLNLPFMKLYRDISSCVDLKSHSVTKNSFVSFRQVTFKELSNLKAVITIEPMLLKYFESRQPILFYKYDVWREISWDWCQRIKGQIGIIKAGSVVTSFRVSIDGKITAPRVLSNTANESLAANCLCSLMDTHLKPIDQKTKQLLTTDYLDLKFCFTFYEDYENEESFVYIV